MCHLIITLFVYLSVTMFALIPVPCLISLLLKGFDRAGNFIHVLRLKYRYFRRECRSDKIMLAEYIALTVQAIALITGFKESVLIGKDQAGIFLSILATIFTIHIALWALISGTLDKDYMGIYYAEYIFNFKPHVYTQRTVMFSSFVFLVFSCLCYIFTFYHMAGAFLFCEIVSIAMSAMFIYSIFKNQEAIKDDIYTYSLKKHFEQARVQGSTGIKITEDIQGRFINAFSKALFNGDRLLSEEYIDIMCHIVLRAWKLRWQGDKSPYTLERIQNNFRTLLYASSDSDKKVSKLLFVKLLSKIYRQLSENIRNEKLLYTDIPANRVSRKKRLYFDILYDWNSYTFFSRILSEIDIKTLKNEVSVSNLLYNIQIVDFALFIESLRDKKEIIFWSPNFSVVYIQQYIGWYLNKQIKSDDISYGELLAFAKEFILSKNTMNYITISGDLNPVLMKAFSIENAMYICGLITSGLTDTAGDVFLPYLNIENSHSYHHYESDSYDSERINFQFIFHVTPFCYLYYLGFWENEKYVKPELRKKAKKLAKELSSHYKKLLKLNEVLKLMIYELRDETSGSPRYISSIMRRFDHRADKEEFYTILTEDMVRDFCLFSVLFAESGRYCLNWIGDSRHDKGRYHDYIKNETETRRKLNDFLEFMNESDTCIIRYENEDKKPEKLSDFFESIDESNNYSVDELFEKLMTYGQCK